MCQYSSQASPFNFVLPDPDPRILRVIALGRSELVENYIQTQYRLRFAEVHEWSARQTTPNSGEVICLLNKRIILGL